MSILFFVHVYEHVFSKCALSYTISHTHMITKLLSFLCNFISNRFLGVHLFQTEMHKPFGKCAQYNVGIILAAFIMLFVTCRLKSDTALKKMSNMNIISSYFHS